ncbi:terpene synthase family protein [Streptomyces chartreusis]|uniref:terpene synthase family protein n=1 Tax=Streptomyces chartreusis TaxID=1969 RepID=UPI0038152263
MLPQADQDERDLPIRLLEPFGLGLNDIPRACHPQAVRAHELTREWADEYGLIGDADRRRRFDRLGYSRLLAYGCTTAPLEDLALYSQWFAYYFLLDDQQDLAILTGRHSSFIALQDQLRRVMHSRGLVDGAQRETGLVAAVADLCRRTAPQVSDGWWCRYVTHAENVFAAQRLESAHRLTGSVPTLDEFLEIRRRASSVDMVFDIIEACEGYEIPEPIRYSWPCCKYADDLNDFTTWSNDVLGVDHDAGNGDINNYVLVSERTAGLSRWEATESVSSNIRMLARRLPERADQVHRLAREYGEEHGERVTRVLNAWHAWAMNVPVHYLRADSRLWQMDLAAPRTPPAFTADLLPHRPHPAAPLDIAGVTHG